MPDDTTAHGTRYSAAALLARIAELEARFAAAPNTDAVVTTNEAARHYAKRRANAERAWRYRREARRIKHAYRSAVQSRARLRDGFRAARSKADTWMHSWLRAVGLAARHEARVAELEAAIRTHQRETATGCHVDHELWRHLEGGS